MVDDKWFGDNWWVAVRARRRRRRRREVEDTTLKTKTPHVNAVNKTAGPMPESQTGESQWGLQFRFVFDSRLIFQSSVRSLAYDCVKGI